MATTQNEEVFQFLTGSSDNGMSISFNVETKPNNIAVNFEHLINPAELLIEIEQGNNITIMVAMDSGPFKPLGVVNAGMSRLVFDIDPTTGDFPRCRQMAIAYREVSKSAVRILELALNYYELEDVANVLESESA